MSQDLSYILPPEPSRGRERRELDRYVRWLSRRVQLIVVDGSDPDRVRAHRERWGSIATLAVPDADVRCLNGKVRGVLTGLRRARHEHVIIADDDVRYDDEALRMQELLRNADLVRPQNFFDPIPWHAHWDTSRMLLNRALGNDHPGTLGVRRSFLTSIGGYDGGVLFENLELVRTVLAAGGRVVDAPEMYVRRLPPTTARFLNSAFARRTTTWRNPPGWRSSWCSGRRLDGGAASTWGFLAAAVASVLVAQVGRLRHGGNRVFDRVSPFFAPFWMVERACLVWLAVFRRFSRGGCTYAGGVIRRAATPLGSFGGCGDGSRAERHDLVGAVAERLRGRTAAPTNRVHAAPDRDLVSALVDEADRPSHEQRTVRRDADDAHRGSAAHELRPRSDMPWICISRSAPIWSSMQYRVAGRTASLSGPIAFPHASHVP